MLPDKVTTARAQLISGGILREADFQRVEAAVELQTLGRESQHVDEFGLRGNLFEAFRKVVVVVKEGSSGRIRQFSHHVGIGRRVFNRDLRPEGGGHGRW